MGLAKVSDRLWPPDTVHVVLLLDSSGHEIFLLSLIRELASDWCSIISVSAILLAAVADKLCFLLTLPFLRERERERERQTPSISTSSIVQSKMPFARLLPSCPKRRRLDFPRATFSHPLTRLFFHPTFDVLCAGDSNSQTLFRDFFFIFLFLF